MNLLVGATGCIGGHVVEYLFRQNEISKGIFRKGAHLKLMDLNGVQCIEADMLDHHSLHEAVEGVETIYSMASPMSGVDEGFERFNTEGVTNMLEAAQEAGVKAIVHLSTIDVYGFRAGKVSTSSVPNPGGEYQKSKLEADRMLLEFAKRNSAPRITIIRSARAMGARDTSLTVPLLRLIDTGRVAVPRAGEMSFSHPNDIALAMYKAATNQTLAGRLYLVKSFDASPETLVRGLAEALGKSVEVRSLGLLTRPQLPPYAAEQLKASLSVENQASWQELGYSPAYDLKKACEEVAAWCQREPWLAED